MKRAGIFLILSVIFTTVITAVMPQGTFAATKTVTVTLPGFPVTFNGIQVDNSDRQYPLIVYKDITYFPMTYHDSRFLGIETKWDQEKGLSIHKTGISAAYRDYRGKAKNPRKFTAAIPSFPVQVNGKSIDQAKEPYPFLIFRDVTYFPLTWKLAVEELGWDYHFDVKTGLAIRSTNSVPRQAVLPGYTDGQVIIVDGHYYYQGEDGAIMQAPVDQPHHAKKVYPLPVWSYGDGTVRTQASLMKKDGEAWLVYHQGGAVMGSNHYVKLNPDGTAEEIVSGYLTFKTFGNMTIKVSHGVPPSPGNLFVQYAGQPEKPLGDPAYLYGWRWEKRENSQGGGASDDLYFVDGHIYLLAFHMEKDTDASRIHMVDPRTNETKRVSDLTAKSFVIEGDALYFASGGKLYKQSLHGGKEELLPTVGSVSDEFPIRVLQGKVYYVNSQDHKLYESGRNTPLHDGGRVTGMTLEDNYLLCTFAEERSNPYRLIVFDQNGKAVFRSSDVAAYLSVGEGKLVYVENESKNVYTIDLETVTNPFVENETERFRM